MRNTFENGKQKEENYVIKVDELVSLSGVIKQHVILLRKGLANLVVVRIQRHFEAVDAISTSPSQLFKKLR